VLSDQLTNCPVAQSGCSIQPTHSHQRTSSIYQPSFSPPYLYLSSSSPLTNPPSIKFPHPNYTHILCLPIRATCPANRGVHFTKRPVRIRAVCCHRPYSGTWTHKIDFPIKVQAAAMSGHGKLVSG